VLGKWALKERRYGQHFNGIMFRRTTVSSEDAIERSREIYGALGGKFNEQSLRWRMPNGGRVSFRYLENIKDADEWQGRNVTDAWVEEAGQYADPKPIDRLFGVLRSAHRVPIQLILTANPGGAGQQWLRSRYGLVPFPQGPKILERQLPNGAVHKVAVIPSRIGDNRILLHNDPGYIDRLHLVGSAHLVKGWLSGDWTAIEGAFFDCWSEGNAKPILVRIPTGCCAVTKI
jgi:Phage terminase large subunit